MMTNWKNKRVFISGGAGVIGTPLVQSLSDLKAQLLVGDLKVKPQSWPQDIAYRQGDLISLLPEEIKEFSPEVFFHLAATFERSEETYPFWQENFHHNISLSHHLMSLIKDLSSLKKVIFASSYLVYDPKQYLFSTPVSNTTSLQEDSPLSPRNLCGMAKLLHEEELLFLKKFRPHLQIISPRIFRSYGKNSRDIISRWIRSLINHEAIHVYRPEGRFDFIYADDVAEGLLRLAATDFNGVVNLGTGSSYTIENVVSMLQSHFKDALIKKQASDILYEASQANMQLFYQLTKWNQFRTIEKGLTEIIEFETRLVS